MIKKGSIIAANIDHFDEQFGDLYIEKGDQFEVIDRDIFTLTMKPINNDKYEGELSVISKEEFFDESC